MRSVSVLFAAAAAFLMACNSGQPTTYLIALDPTPLGTLASACYVDNSAPGTTPGSTRNTAQNFRGEMTWVIWDGNDGFEYLDMGGVSFPLGNAEAITVSSLIQGQDDTFSGQQTAVTLTDNNGFSATRNKSITVTFDKRGTAPSGRIALNSSFQCSNCGEMMSQSGNRSCSTDLTFDGRRVDVDRIAAHDN